MDAIKFLKNLNRMCESVSGCSNCPIGSLREARGLPCGLYVQRYPEEVLFIVKIWSDEHPVKTRLADFKKKYPNAKYSVPNKVPSACAGTLGYTETKPGSVCPYKGTGVSCEQCWAMSMEG